MNFETIRYEKKVALAIITMNRPEKLNSINSIMRGELHFAIKSAGQDGDVSVILLTGEGRAFCAGQDLSERLVSSSSDAKDLGESLELGYNPIISSIVSSEKPVICALNGVGAGAGANLAIACDIILASESSYLLQSFVNIGLVPDCGGTWMLPRKLGMSRAMALAMTGEKLTSYQAEQWGLVWKRYPDDVFKYCSLRFSLDLARKSSLALSSIKSAINSSSGNSLEEQLFLEANLQRRCGSTVEYCESVRNFFDKRASL